MRLILLVLLSLWSGLAIAADTTIEMLNKLDNEYMVFSEKIVYIDPGDTVFWKATDKGHNVEFVKGAVPTGVKAFKSKLNVDTEYKFGIPGIYAYWCTPHKTMGMIGFVVVGNDLSNFNEVAKKKFLGKSKKIHRLLTKLEAKTNHNELKQLFQCQTTLIVILFSFFFSDLFISHFGIIISIHINTSTTFRSFETTTFIYYRH